LKYSRQKRNNPRSLFHSFPWKIKPF